MAVRYKQNPSIRQTTVFVIRVALYWGFGYILFWATKWVLVSLLTDYSIFADAAASLAGRFSGSISDVMKAIAYNFAVLVPREFGISVTSRLMVLFSLAVIVLAMSLLAAFLLKKKGLSLRYEPSFLVIARFPILWFAIVGEHSRIHYWMTNRILFISLFALFLFAKFSLTVFNPVYAAYSPSE
jgi:hypothetical protein